MRQGELLLMNLKNTCEQTDGDYSEDRAVIMPDLPRMPRKSAVEFRCVKPSLYAFAALDIAQVFVKLQ